MLKALRVLKTSHLIEYFFQFQPELNSTIAMNSTPSRISRLTKLREEDQVLVYNAKTFFIYQL